MQRQGSSLNPRKIQQYPKWFLSTTQNILSCPSSKCKPNTNKQKQKRFTKQTETIYKIYKGRPVA